jgi:ABC-type nitrate/sulfonate/bicarbonate transport system ATPase subunit
VSQLDPIVRWLWPVPVVMFVVYPYLKRLTWLCHLWLGACLGLAPVGAWLAVAGTAPWEAWAIAGAVALWVAGFDLFYSLFDLEHDRREGLYSWAVRFGEHGVFTGALGRARRMIRGRGLEKRYGRRRVLQGVDLDLQQGGFAVVTGPNGSGKTTLLRLLAGLALPTRGELVVEADRSRIGYLAHEPLVYRELTAVENLDLFGRLYRVPERRERIGMLLERFALWEARNERVSTYSRGMTQRLALCRALLHDPDLLVLDEPYSALDEDGFALLDRELGALAGARTVVVATHEPERLARFQTRRLALA